MRDAKSETVRESSKIVTLSLAPALRKTMILMVLVINPNKIMAGGKSEDTALITME